MDHHNFMVTFQLSRLADLEEIVADQDNKLAVSLENLNKAKNDMEKVKEAKEVELKLQKKKMRLYDVVHFHLDMKMII